MVWWLLPFPSNDEVASSIPSPAITFFGSLNRKKEGKCADLERCGGVRPFAVYTLTGRKKGRKIGRLKRGIENAQLCRRGDLSCSSRDERAPHLRHPLNRPSHHGREGWLLAHFFCYFDLYF